MATKTSKKTGTKAEATVPKAKYDKLLEFTRELKRKHAGLYELAEELELYHERKTVADFYIASFDIPPEVDEA